jgi:pteridine reductase
MDFRDRVVVVTGAGRRVGQAIAVALGAKGQGLRVAVHFNESRAGADDTVAKIVAAGGLAEAFEADLGDPSSPERLIADVTARFGRLDVLVNSAAIMRQTPFGQITVKDWDEIFALNLRAPFFLAQAAAPHLARAPGGGAIVNIADLAAFETWPDYLPHGISKSGIVNATRGLARTLAPHVRVNAVAPGVILLPKGWTDDAAERLRQSTPLGRLGDPTDVARTVVFLIESDYITGETIIVDGGRHVRD